MAESKFQSSPLTVEAIGEAIGRHYGIETAALDFRAKGWGGDSYIAVSTMGERFFVKLQPLTGPEWASAPSEPRFYLPLLHQLYAESVIRVPRLVLTTEGAYSTVIDGFELVLYEFIEGEVVGFGKLPEPVLAELAAIVGKLHRSTHGLRFDHPFTERYGLSIEPVLRQALAQLAGPESPASPGVKQLRMSINRIRAPLLNHLARFKTLQAHARVRNKPQVICHTDLHGGNLMVDRNGELIVLDWENAMLAPAEADLYFIAGEPEFREVFLPGYEKEGGSLDLDADLLGFYWYRRALEDVAGFITRIQAGDGDERRDLEDIEMLLENTAWLDRIDGDVARFRRKLDRM